MCISNCVTMFTQSCYPGVHSSRIIEHLQTCTITAYYVDLIVASNFIKLLAMQRLNDASAKEMIVPGSLFQLVRVTRVESYNGQISNWTGLMLLSLGLPRSDDCYSLCWLDWGSSLQVLLGAPVTNQPIYRGTVYNLQSICEQMQQAWENIELLPGWLRKTTSSLDIELAKLARVFSPHYSPILLHCIHFVLSFTCPLNDASIHLHIVVCIHCRWCLSTIGGGLGDSKQVNIKIYSECVIQWTKICIGRAYWCNLREALGGYKWVNIEMTFGGWYEVYIQIHLEATIKQRY